MKTTAAMKLVFRIGKCRFSLPVEDLVEIRENAAGLIDVSGADAEGLVVGSLFHRGRDILIHDLGARLKIADAGRADGRAILVLAFGELPWGVIADEVVGLFPETEFSSLAMPPVLAGSGTRPYAGLDRWRDELLVRCEARRMDASWEMR